MTRLRRPGIPSQKQLRKFVGRLLIRWPEIVFVRPRPFAMNGTLMQLQQARRYWLGYSITSSARANSLGGTVRPSA